VRPAAAGPVEPQKAPERRVDLARNETSFRLLCGKCRRTVVYVDWVGSGIENVFRVNLSFAFPMKDILEN
jgi:hypothetical protein